MAAVDFLYHENPPTWAGVEPATLGAEDQRQTNHATQPAIQKASDVSRFQLNRANRRVQPHESMDLTYQQGTVQDGGGSVMVWGECSWSDMRPFIRLDTTLTGDRYVSILFDHLYPFLSIVHSDGLGESPQDNAIPHTSRSATYWLQEHSSEFRHFRWPPKSPDMSIIECI
ncbi:transposable element Tcb2 transposase [Trichonephila clavipes]|nr:transposable element Tcb2 transposase [Trichonephila clavipes]